MVTIWGSECNPGILFPSLSDGALFKSLRPNYYNNNDNNNSTFAFFFGSLPFAKPGDIIRGIPAFKSNICALSVEQSKNV